MSARVVDLDAERHQLIEETELEGTMTLHPATVLRVERGEGNVIEVRWDHPGDNDDVSRALRPTPTEMAVLAVELYVGMS
jgi:hypothetical protein